jgi:L-alanine-DL-glutamate epimerase-like enolase superfamily enzyme
MIIRHTIGLADPLTDADIPAVERLDDGLPQSLAACTQAYGLRQFKIKVSGELARDRERLPRIARVLAAHALPDYRFSFDGNEQFHSFADFRAFWDELSATAALQEFFGHLRFIEQPLHRDVALRPEVGARMRERPLLQRIIIDESDGDLDSLPRALELGYAGTSHKNCKGVFKGIANACLIAQRRRAEPNRPLLMTGEDLANIGPVALLQDLAVCAALGLQGIERNGHHYFAGLSMFPPTVQRQVLTAHGDLYHPSRAGWPTLHIQEGAVQIGSVVAAPFGVSFELEVEQFSLVADCH